jgi:hypothetical protein
LATAVLQSTTQKRSALGYQSGTIRIPAKDEASSMKVVRAVVMAVVGAIAAMLALIIVGIAVFGLVLPAVHKHRIRAFCDDVKIGENAEALWNRGGSFERARGKDTGIALEAGDSDNLDFSVVLPSIGISIWSCNVSVDQKGQVSSKSLGHAD